MGLNDMIYTLVNLFLPDRCISSLLQDHWMDGACLKVLITKALGYAIICGSVLVKAPQIWKIVQAGDARGMSVVGVCLELISIMGTMCYSISMQFPFSAYGESIFMVIQQSIIFFLLFLFNHSASLAFMAYAVFIGILSFLLSPFAPLFFLHILQASVIFLLIASRLSQAMSNYSNSSTGQLSFISVFLQWAGAGARIFTTLSEVGDMTTTLMYLASFSTNSLLLFQLFYYWNSQCNSNNKGKSNNNKDIKGDFKNKANNKEVDNKKSNSDKSGLGGISKVKRLQKID